MRAGLAVSGANHQSSPKRRPEPAFQSARFFLPWSLTVMYVHRKLRTVRQIQAARNGGCTPKRAYPAKHEVKVMSRAAGGRCCAHAVRQWKRKGIRGYLDSWRATKTNRGFVIAGSSICIATSQPCLAGPEQGRPPEHCRRDRARQFTLAGFFLSLDQPYHPAPLCSIQCMHDVVPIE